MSAGFGLLATGLAIILIAAYGEVSEYGILIIFGCFIGGFAVTAILRRIYEDGQE